MTMLFRLLNGRITRACACTLSVLLAACGTAVPVSIDIPATTDMARGSRICIGMSKDKNVQMPERTIARVQRAAIKASEFVEALGCFQVTDINNCDFSLEYGAKGESSSDRLYFSSLYSYKKYGTHKRHNTAIASRILGREATSEFLTVFHGDRPEVFANEGLALILPYNIKINNFKVSAGADNPELKQAVEACKKDDWGAGEKLIIAALAAHPQDPETHFMRGLLAIQQRDFAGAERYFASADSIKHSSRYTKAKKVLGSIVNYHNEAAQQMAKFGLTRTPIKVYTTERF